MKKIIAIFAALAVITSCVGCSAKDNENPETEEVVTSEAENTSVPEDDTADAAPEAETADAADAATAEQEDTSAAETETADAAPEATTTEVASEEDEPEDSLNEMLDDRGDGLWLVNISDKADSWENNIKFSIYYDYEGLVTRMEIEKLGDKLRMDTEVFGFVMDVLVDGTNTYFIDDNTSTYCIDTSGSVYDASEAESYLMAEDAEEAFVEAGTETVNGVDYIYEEYQVDGQNIRYYFDEECTLHYIGSEVEGEKMYIDFTIEFADEPDETAFTVPEGYTEVTEDEYYANVYGDLFSFETFEITE